MLTLVTLYDLLAEWCTSSKTGTGRAVEFGWLTRGDIDVDGWAGDVPVYW